MFGFNLRNLIEFGMKGKSPLRYAITEKCTDFTDSAQELRSITKLSYEVCFTSMCEWLIKRRLNSTEIIPHVEMLYRI